MQRRIWGLAGAILAGVAGAVGMFVFTTVAAHEVPHAVVVGFSAVGAGLLAMLAGGSASARAAVSDLRSAGRAGLGGILMFWAAPLVVLFQRATDAPTGTETVFFTTACWGAVVALASLFAQRTPLSWVRVIGAVVSVTGSAVLLASWETPSSFSPFVRFLDRELIMVAAGAVFAGGAVLLVASARRTGWRTALFVAGLGAVLFGTLIGASGLVAEWRSVVRLAPALLALAVASAVFSAGWTGVLRSSGMPLASTILLAVPAGLTGLSVVERLTGVRGPDPIRWGSAGAGIALVTAGAIVVVAAARAKRPLSRGHGSAARWAIIVLSLAAASVALITPALRGEVTGSLGDGFHAVWTMWGVEAAAGWSVAATALMAGAASWAMSIGEERSALATSIATLVCASVTPLTSSLPLRTWTNWIPPDVQQVYGTEYARLTFSAVESLPRNAVLVVSVAVAVLTVAILARRRAVDVSAVKGRA